MNRNYDRLVDRTVPRRRDAIERVRREEQDTQIRFAIRSDSGTQFLREIRA